MLKFIKKHQTPILLILISALGFIIRFYKLGIAPAGLYLDEAGQGYAAYSILKTGKDEFGKVFPIVFRNFTDFKTPVYIYFIVPLISIFGLTKFTVRFPSAFFSLLTFPILYLLIKQIIPSKKQGNRLALLSTFLLAISPWHTLFGRTNFECNLALFFMLLGSLLFFKALKKPKILLLSSFSYAIAIPAYHAQRLITPLLLLILFVRYHRQLFKKTHRKYFIASLLLGLILLLPTLMVSFTPGFLARASGLNIFNYSKQNPAGLLTSYTGIFSNLINSRLFLSIREFSSLYISYFSPRNLFWLGDYGPRSSFPQLSTFYVWQLPFYLSGFYYLVKNKNLGTLRFYTLSLLLISPLPAAVTRDPFSTIRSLQIVIPLTIVIALGITNLYKKLKKYRWLLTISTLAIIFYSLLKLYSSTILLNEYHRAKYWNYGWQQVADVIQHNTNPNLPIVVDNSRGEPYIQLLFFLRFNPSTYQQQNFEVPLDQYYTNMDRNLTKKIGRITTHPINWKQDLKIDQYLIGDKLSISDQQIKEHKLKLIDKIHYPDGKVAFVIVQTNPSFHNRRQPL